ncbi:uncharacterized protein LOC132051015 isoform X1 [Lycium ferocissimum]|uniref:uncharacterized protein LOC132051015 isoform X1 n=1 Tax=Lycium ferocissimum TaxID=112874 RepID=UPI002816767F|nr:uncharacterized protein LOC132051015 isoform X1 [Lycium ferocissimum]
MAFANAQIFLLLAVFSSLFPIGLADFNWGPRSWSKTNCPYTTEHPPNVTQTSNKFVVGGSEDWHYGFNYRMDWARKCAPFFVNDTLVFKYDPPNANGTGFPHSVYLLKNYGSLIRCNFTGAKRIADPTEGAGEGFEFVLNKMRPYYFACGENEGVHCKTGNMKFFVIPLKHRST